MEQDKDKYKELSKRATELLADSYSVPLYQRGFAWEDEQIETLLSDICYAMERRALFRRYDCSHRAHL